MWIVKNVRTGDVVGKYKSMKSAYRKADKVDSEYGAVCCIVTRAD